MTLWSMYPFIKKEIFSRTILVLGWSSFFIQFSTSMVFSISPFYMRNVLGLTNTSSFIIEGITETLFNGSRFFSGYLHDKKIDQKKIFLFGACLSLFAKPLFAMAGLLAPIFLSVILSKILDHLSNGILSVSREIIAINNANYSTKGIMLGYIGLIKSVSIMLGSFAATGILFCFFSECPLNGYRLILWISIVPCIIGSGIFFIGFPKKSFSTGSFSINSYKFSFDNLRSLGFSYWSLMIVVFILSLSRVNDQIIALRAQELPFPSFFQTSTIAIFNLTAAIVSIPVGLFTTYKYQNQLLIFSFCFLIISNLLLSHDSLIVYTLGVIFWGIQRGSLGVAFSSIIADIVPKNILGTSLGVYYLLIGLSTIITSFIVGRISDKFGYQSTFSYGSVVSFLALISLILRNYLLTKKNKRMKNDNM